MMCADSVTRVSNTARENLYARMVQASSNPRARELAGFEGRYEGGLRAHESRL